MIDTLSSRLPALRSEGGLTLIELLVASMLALVLFTALFTLLDTSQRVQARDTEWALALQSNRAGLARMTHEIRQTSAKELKKAEPSTIEFMATVGSEYWKVKYVCSVTQTTSLDECVRYAVEEGSLSAAEKATLPSKGETVVSDVLNGTKVFCYSHGAKVCTESPSTTEREEATIVTLKVELHAVGELKQIDNSGYTGKKVVLENAAFMRNQDLEG
jgi:Tfp pilus assembly protein PilW